MQRFEHGHIVTESREFVRTAQAGRPGANHRNAMSVGGWHLRVVLLIGPVPVRCISLQPADSDRFPLNGAHTYLFALVFLRADPAADCGQGITQFECRICTPRIPVFDLTDESRDIDSDRASGHAGPMPAVQTPRGFTGSQIRIVSQRDFFKPVMRSAGSNSGMGVFRRISSISAHLPEQSAVFFPFLFLGSIKSATPEGLIKIDFMGVKFGAVHTGEHRFFRPR